MSFTRLPHSAKPLKITGTPSRFTSSTGPDGCDRCFCSNCGTSVYDDSPNVQAQSFCSGALTDHAKLARIEGHEFTWFADDGGLSVWLPKTTIWEVGDDQTPTEGNHYAEMDVKIPEPGEQEGVEASCYCGGVKFVVTRANEQSRGIDWPSDILPKRDGGKKWVGKVCACDSCRQAGGFHLAPWVYVAHVNIRDTDSAKIFDFGAGLLRAYSSSTGVKRHFCGRCGAKVFFRNTKRPDIIDINAGLLEAKSGARAEEWVEWVHEVAEWEDAKDEELVKALKEGMAERKAKLQKLASS